MPIHRFSVIVCVGFLAVSLIPLPAGSATIHVPADQPTIQAGIDAAVAGDSVFLACGDYYETSIVMKQGVHLLSEGALCANIMGESAGRIMSLADADGSTIIESITFWNGSTEEDGSGAALLLADASPRLENCVFIQNHADYSGGAVYCRNSTASFENCWFLTNSGGNGGGGAIRATYCDLTITDCLFEGNTAVDGGALFLSHTTGTVEGCLFRGDTAQFWGGAVACISESTPTFRGCTFSGNGAHQGGGLWAAAESHPVLENCIVAFAYEGAGLWTDHHPTHPSSFTLNCCDIYGNEGGNYGGDQEDLTGIDGNISAHPMFCGPDFGDYALATDSPCLPENNDCGILMGSSGWGCEGVTGVDALPIPNRLWAMNHPNPFNPSTEIRFIIPEAAQVTLRIYDSSGRLVRTLLDAARRLAGELSASWDGRDDSAQPLPSGVYLYEVTAGNYSAAGKMTLLK